MKKYCLLAFAVLFTLSCKEDVIPIETDVMNTEEWMSNLIQEYPGNDFALRDISLPRAHDAGMYKLVLCSFGANPCNTQTQVLNMKQMLEAGVRMFDVRPELKNGNYWTYHATGCANDGLGCRGDLMVNMLDMVKNFLDTYEELVIFDIGHFCNTNANDAGFIELLNTHLGDRMYKEPMENPVAFIDRPLSEIIPPGTNSGKVVCLMDGVSNTAANRAEGIFAHSFIKRAGSYANRYEFEPMKADQLAKFQNYDENGNRLFELNWTQTLDTELAVQCALNLEASSINDFAYIANTQLGSTIDEWIADGTITPDKIPNIISVDFSDKFVTEQTLRLSRFSIE